MARSYKSALPTWTTYTPHVGPLQVQAPINQENWWRNRAVYHPVPSIQGHLNRIGMDINSMVKGTGAAQTVGGILQHRPITQALEQRAQANRQGDPRTQWARQTQQAMQPVAPSPPPPPGAVKPRTAPPSVNPANVVQQQAVQQGIGGMANAVVTTSSPAAPATLPVIPTVPFAPGVVIPGAASGAGMSTTRPKIIIQNRG